MEFIINPLKGVGDLRFGMTSDEVKSLLGNDFHSFKRTPAMAYPCDCFENIGLFAYYKANGTLEALEFAEPADPIIYGVHLIGVNAQNLRGMFERENSVLEIDSSGFVSYSCGVGVYAPGWDENNEQVVEGVIVFEEGYFQ